MHPRAAKQFYLVPETGIEVINGQTFAAACPAWFRIEPIAALARHNWIRLHYSASFFDEPVRPLIRFTLADGETITLPMNGPVLGSAEWVGRVPTDTVAAFISPVRRTGAFDFRLEAIGPVRRTELIFQGLRRPGLLFWAIRSRLLNFRRLAWQALNFAAGGTPMKAYATWHARLSRPIDPGGFDRPRSDWSKGPSFRLVLDLRRGGADALLKTLRSLQAQVYARWQLHAVCDSTTDKALLALFQEHARGDARLLQAIPEFASRGGDTKAVDDRDCLLVINAGDQLAPYALAIIAEEIARQPDLDLVYADEDRITTRGNLHSPVLKPDWSPVLQAQRPYLGGAVFFRGRRIAGESFAALLADRETMVDKLAQEISPRAIRHVRRVLYSRQQSPHDDAQIAAVTRSAAADPPQWPPVAVVIATRDHGKLLANCLAGLRDKTDYPSLEIVVVDNGSTRADAKRLLGKLATAPDIKVLHRPGPFNFSALSNEGARATSAPVLLFLNNDIVMIEPNWLKAMVRWAVKPAIGTVGAKLLFANGRIQHAGVVLGFGGIAGHDYLRLPKDHSGYLSRLTVPHEVSAVTAACMAVERSKFEAVNGFDTKNLPVDLNDIDFCLRIAESGLANLWTPEATLIHLESATRGVDGDTFALYRQERSYFVRRWAEAIRDDPYFHPALSLYAGDVELV